MRISLVGVLVCVVAFVGFGVFSSQLTHEDVQRALMALTPENYQQLMGFFLLGFERGRMDVAATYRLINRLKAYEGEQDDKEQILMTIGQALQDDLPVRMLMENTEEGMARGAPLSLILRGAAGQPPILGLTQREYLLGATRDTLYIGRIFSAPPGVKAATQSLPAARFDLLVNEIADCLADYVESGRSPLEGHLLYKQVSERLTNLANLKVPIVPSSDVQLVLERITPADLSFIVAKIYEKEGQ
jgi:hypothetical protein